MLEPTKSQRFSQYLVDKSSGNDNNVLSDLFGEDAGLKQTSEAGKCLDQSQINILSKSWRCEDPEKLSAYKEEYKSVFPVHESSMKGWGKNRQLVSQPLKAIESVAFQGHTAARYALISVAYSQQALGKLLNELQSNNINIDRAV